eukprot:COSAG05_NODE_1294_length_5255_cov_3.346974_5_plen_88_part_00
MFENVGLNVHAPICMSKLEEEEEEEEEDEDGGYAGLKVYNPHLYAELSCASPACGQAAMPCLSTMARIACWHVPGAPGQPEPNRFSK